MWHKAPCSSRDYSGVRESGPHKIDEDGDADGDVDEDNHRGDDSPPDGTPVPPRERRVSDHHKEAIKPRVSKGEVEIIPS